MLEVDDIAEFIVLVKVFYGLKYGIDEDDKSFILRSPYFSKIFNKALIELLERSGKYTQEKSSEWHIDNRPIERQKIIAELKEVASWDKLDDATKKEIVQILLSPFFYDEKVVNDLTQEIDSAK